jgi:hypothetical protein
MHRPAHARSTKITSLAQLTALQIALGYGVFKRIMRCWHVCLPQSKAMSTVPKLPKSAWISAPEGHSTGRIKLLDRMIWPGSMLWPYCAIRCARCCQTNERKHQYSFDENVYEVTKDRHSVRAASRLTLNVLRFESDLCELKRL